MDKKLTPVIGLEIHIEPNTKTKMFCGCPQDHFGKSPNTQVCPICLGLPGALPYANRAAIEKTILLGLALGSAISSKSKFYRKNYFYPDLPKGFQTSQLDAPFCVGGSLNGMEINLWRLGEDEGYLVHENIDGLKCSLVDFNRSGCALIELVTEPVFHDLKTVIEFVKELQLIARYLDVSGADMEKGSMRLEANVSLATEEQISSNTRPDYKVELKNINSFKFLEKAVSAELIRQEKAILKGEELVQETRGYDEVKQITFSQRTKADAHDYRYFPEADLPPVSITPEEIESLRAKVPTLPAAKRKEFMDKYGLSKDFADILVSDLPRADYFVECCRLNNNYKLIADLIINKKLDQEFPEPAGLVRRIVEIANVSYASSDEVSAAVKNVLSENEKAVNDYKGGNSNVVGFLIGMTQKKLQGKGNPKMVSETIIKYLQE